MRLRQIEIFYHVYRAGSISGAARDLHVSQPSVSKVLRHAEDQLGFDLFIRQKGRLFPTAAAHELYDEVRDVYRRISAFNRTAGNIRKRKGGHVRLAVLPSLSLSAAPEAIANLRRSHSDLSFELTTLHSDELADALVEKKCDLCVGFEKLEDERIAIQPIGTGHFVMVTREERSAEASDKDMTALNEADFIGMNGSGPLAAMLSKAMEERQIHPNEVVTTHTYHMALALVRKGVGLAITDQFTADSHLGQSLYSYPLEEIPPFPVFAAWLKDNHEPKLIETCVDALSGSISGSG